MEIVSAVLAAIDFITNAINSYAATPEGQADIAKVEAELTKLGIDFGQPVVVTPTPNPTGQTPAQRAGIA
jgi:hypothetical protein